MTDPLVMQKKRARAEGRAAVASMSAEARAAASETICDRLAAWWEGTGGPSSGADGKLLPLAGAGEAPGRPPMVMVYLSKPGADGLEEPELGGLIGRLRRRGVRVAAPRMEWESGTMRGVELSFDDAGAVRTEVRRFGVPEPVGEAAGGFGPLDFSVTLVPGVAFDEGGGRVGRGAGFYDRWLGERESLRAGLAGETLGVGDCGGGLVIGVGFDVQVLRGVPRGPRDARMDAIVTERRWIVG